MVEAKLDKGRGPLATVLVQRGTLQVGDIFVAGPISGKVRAMIDDHGRQVKEAGPSVPVEVLGLSGVPSAGDTLTVVENEARAREVAAYRQSVIDTRRTTSAPANFDTMFSALKEKQAVEFPLVIKGDVQGSVEAIVQAVNKISNEDIKARVLHAGVGGITESDVTLAGASGAPIIGFNVRANAKAREIAERQGVAMQYYDVIYDLTDAVKAAMAGELGPLIIENVVGRAEIREVFSAGKHGRAAGLLVTEGFIRKALKARIMRDDVIIYNGSIASLAALQGRRAGGPRGPGVRRHLREPHRHQARRHARDVRDRGARADAVTDGRAAAFGLRQFPAAAGVEAARLDAARCRHDGGDDRDRLRGGRAVRQSGRHGAGRLPRRDARRHAGAGAVRDDRAARSMRRRSASTITFIKAARPGRFVGKGRVVSLGKTIVFTEAELFDESGELVARATFSSRAMSGGKAATAALNLCRRSHVVRAERCL